MLAAHVAEALYALLLHLNIMLYLKKCITHCRPEEATAQPDMEANTQDVLFLGHQAELLQAGIAAHRLVFQVELHALLEELVIIHRFILAGALHKLDRNIALHITEADRAFLVFIPDNAIPLDFLLVGFMIIFQGLEQM